jgi:hypothetical protein
VLHLVVADADADLCPRLRPTVGWQGTCLTKTPETADAGWDTVLAFNLLHLVPDLDHTLAQRRGTCAPAACSSAKPPALPR